MTFTEISCHFSLYRTVSESTAAKQMKKIYRRESDFMRAKDPQQCCKEAPMVKWERIQEVDDFRHNVAYLPNGARLGHSK